MKQYIRAAINLKIPYDYDDMGEVLNSTVLYSGAVAKVSLMSDESYGPVDGLDPSQVADCMRFGMQVENGWLYVPAGLQFDVAINQKSSSWYNPIKLVNNGVEIPWNPLNMDEGIEVVFTPFGLKCYVYAIENDISLVDALEVIT